MGRGQSPTETLASTFVTLRGADRNDAAALRDAVTEATEELQRALAGRKDYSKAEAAALLDVSAPTLDKWIRTGLLPARHVPQYKRARIPSGPLLALAAEVKQLRRLGRNRGLLAEALSRLEEEDPTWRQQFDELYGAARRPPGKEDDYVSAAPGDDWDQND